MGWDLVFDGQLLEADGPLQIFAHDHQLELQGVASVLLGFLQSLCTMCLIDSAKILQLVCADAIPFGDVARRVCSLQILSYRLKSGLRIKLPVSSHNNAPHKAAVLFFNCLLYGEHIMAPRLIS
ncbi:hypothetical protein SDC9_171112 [bioreactor metagenome]|uniref:Uncharacterized protein n=1 Tax=bioreactor metagenome TaxID=1076179 RepID=A0A645GD67_9ZZZZ